METDSERAELERCSMNESQPVDWKQKHHEHSHKESSLFPTRRKKSWGEMV